MNNMTCEELADSLDNDYFFDEMIDESYWNDNFKAENFFKALKTEAEKRGIALTDEEEFDYDSYFWNLYKNSEKGLS